MLLKILKIIAIILIALCVHGGGKWLIDRLSLRRLTQQKRGLREEINNKENTPIKVISKSAEKNQPKKPIYYQANMQTQYIICPNCNDFKGMNPKIPKCLICGQALDWS